MFFPDYEEEQYFHSLWDAVEIARPVHYSIFTFGESELPYFLVCGAKEPGETVSITRGEVKISRPKIITPNNMSAEFRNFFEEMEQGESMIDFLLARSAGFSNLKFDNTSGPKKLVSDSIEEVVAKLNKQLDDEEEEHVAILTAPPSLAGVALLKYAAERVWQSAPDNIQELRERGFLP